MRIAFIVQRYGIEILGGSEYHCRLIAERMAGQHEVDVLTTCARDYITWANEYPEGIARVNGVTVHRFPNAHTRDIDAFNRYSDWIFHNPHTRDDELSWLEQQGPWCPALLDHLGERANTYDAVIFFTYLYAPTVLGLPLAGGRSILVPTAHNEPAIHLGIYKEVFERPKAVAFNTGVEKRFLKATFDTYKEQGGPATLVLMGAKLMPLPNAPWVRYAGLLSEIDRLAALKAATIVVVPSPFESLSLLALEAMAVGNPVLCNAHADVLVDHCRRSNAGLFYSSREEFVECVHLLLADRALRRRMGGNGQTYVAANYSWNVIMSKYDRLIAALSTGR